MAASNDRHAGTNAGRIRGQIEQITNWMDGTQFEHTPGGTDIDRVIAQIDWRAHIDPTLDAATNYRLIKKRYGLRTATDVKTAARNADDQAEQSARRAIRENLAAIDAGEADDLLADIEAEYGEAFVTSELERARADANAEVTGAPDPKDYSPSAVAHANGAPGAPAADPAPAPATPTAPTISPADDGRPDPAGTPNPVTTHAPPSRARRAAGAVSTAVGSTAIPAVAWTARTAFNAVCSLLICLYVLATYSPDYGDFSEASADV